MLETPARSETAPGSHVRAGREDSDGLRTLHPARSMMSDRTPGKPQAEGQQGAGTNTPAAGRMLAPRADARWWVLSSVAVAVVLGIGVILSFYVADQTRVL